MSSSDDWSRNGRQQVLRRLRASNEPVDVLIIGGGITGAGIAREAARRGLKTLLVERQDFAWGTSSRSSKMVHGGLRYMAAGDIKTTLHSVHERERLMKEAPGLVERMNYMMAHYQGHFPGRFAFNLLLFVYDLFAGHKYRRFIDKKTLTAMNPLIRQSGLTGGTQFSDAVTDDARLVMRVLREAQNDGAVAVNYLGVVRLLTENGRVSGAELRDTVSGEVFRQPAQVVINATGAWADKLRGTLGGEQKIRPARGSHIVIAAERLPVKDSFTVLHPADKRPVFIYPWEGRTVIGTTDLDNQGISDCEVGMSQAELDYLLTLVNYQFPGAEITASDVIASWAGVRPLVASGAGSSSAEKRDHSIWNDAGLISVSGGKLTTFRLIALDVLAAAQSSIAGYPAENFAQRVFTPVSQAEPALQLLPQEQKKKFCGYYGMDVKPLLQNARPEELTPVTGTRTLWAELRWAAGHEAVLHLDDLLLRRTRLGLLLADGGLQYAGEIQPICQQELGWDDERWQQEAERYRQIIRRYYSLPG